MLDVGLNSPTCRLFLIFTFILTGTSRLFLDLRAQVACLSGIQRMRLSHFVKPVITKVKHYSIKGTRVRHREQHSMYT